MLIVGDNLVSMLNNILAGFVVLWCCLCSYDDYYGIRAGCQPCWHPWCVVWNFVLFLVRFFCLSGSMRCHCDFFFFSRFYYKYDVNKWILVAWYLLRFFLFVCSHFVLFFFYYYWWRVFKKSWLYTFGCFFT